MVEKDHYTLLASLAETAVSTPKFFADDLTIKGNPGGSKLEIQFKGYEDSEFPDAGIPYSKTFKEAVETMVEVTKRALQKTPSYKSPKYLPEVKALAARLLKERKPSRKLAGRALTWAVDNKLLLDECAQRRRAVTLR